MDTDFVLTWVDDQDPQWRKERKIWLVKSGREAAEDDSTAEMRYRDWGLLRYWFRAVEKYAPWVRKVHFVTCGQIPEWMNTECGRLHIVLHSDYIPPQYLPTFSSHPIELNFHRIPGLAEHFVYFNDDFFLTAPVEETLFFRDGLPCDFPEEKPYTFRVKEQYNDIVLNSQVFLNMHFSRQETVEKQRAKWYCTKGGKAALRNRMLDRLLKHSPFFGFAPFHFAQPYLKKTFEELWKIDPQWMDVTCSHRFRSAMDISPLAARELQYIRGDFYPLFRGKIGQYYKIGPDTEKICRAIRTGNIPLICANDTGIPAEEYESSREKLIRAFSEVFPEKSEFER